MLPVEITWPIAGTTGWGLFGLHLALGMQRAGRQVFVPQIDGSGIAPTLYPSLQKMQSVNNDYRIIFDTWGNHKPKWVDRGKAFRVLLAVFEDTAAVDVETMQRYDLILAPSRWIQGLLEGHGIESTLWHQGYDDSLFYPAPKRRTDGRFMVFSGGKLEFRKGQDIVIEAFKRFRETPEGKDAILVTAWQNLWPATMDGIWLSGYVKGVPSLRGGQLDISGWLEINGIPRDAHMDLGMLSQAEMANAIRECDVAVFPSRCEGATNMALVEALACGIPVTGTRECGQADVPFWAGIGNVGLQVPQGCRLYQGTDGWYEASPLVLALNMQSVAERSSMIWQPDISLWRWREKARELHSLLSERADG